ncbi:MAG: M48 family metalloprotease [Rubrivivax sp.]
MNADHPPCKGLARRLERNALNRRDSLWLMGASLGTGALLQGCATSPVSGQRILVGMSEAQEIAVDRAQSPHQFSADLGPVQDAQVNTYVSEVGQRVHDRVERAGLPYSYRALNANYVNAYTFPAGAVGITRGILVQLQDESELAALIGHELGHVNARHAAQRQGQALLAQVALAGLAASTERSDWAPLLGLGAQIGARALLARYSRDNEREADALGQRYLVEAGYPAGGMVRLHQMLVEQSREQPSQLETLFSSHPMSAQRLETARLLAESDYAASARAPAQRERYMDRTASLRALAPTIEACQKGETAMSRKSHAEAERQFATALRLTPRDYPALLRMAQCQQAQGRLREAQRYVRSAREVYPQEAQAMKLAASLKLGLRDPSGALADLQDYERVLPGDDGITFLQGVSLEAMGRRDAAAQQYARYLRSVPQGQASTHAMSRLRAWGLVR